MGCGNRKPIWLGTVIVLVILMIGSTLLLTLLPGPFHFAHGNDNDTTSIPTTSMESSVLHSTRATLGHYQYHAQHHPVMKRQSDFIMTTGGPASIGSSPLRLEIRDLQKQTDQWTLYLLAMDWMQFQSQTDDLSWYGIMGIHGRPFKTFDNVMPMQGNEDSGYCVHDSILFLPWHRPYIALFEQEVINRALIIASLYPTEEERARYNAAAMTLRVPYWDWAAIPKDGDSVFPHSVGDSPVITIDGPSGRQVMANPLYSYFFESRIPGDLPEPPCSYWNQTIRSPSQPVGPESVSEEDKVFTTFSSLTDPTPRSRLYNVMTNPFYANFSLFGDATFHDSLGYDSLESIHDWIHGYSGMGGHMTYIAYSAFDPLFMLHHANVDRLFAMYQVLNPDSYVVPTPASQTSFTTARGQIQDINTDLTPFRSPIGFWTAATVRGLSVFNYQYSETANRDNLTQEGLQAQVRTAINALYAPFSVSAASRSIPGTAHTQVIANIVANKNGIGGPYYINLYLDGLKIGSHFITAMLNHQTDLQVSATIPLPDQFTSKNLSSLTSRLKYRVVKADGAAVSASEMNGLVNMTLVSNNLILPVKADEFPIWGSAVVRGKVAGVI